MPGFKRRQLSGSEELFRATSHEDSDELGEGEIRWLIEALQVMRFPERNRPRLTMSQFEELGRLQEKLRAYLSDSP
jgi:hypothetical protein